MQEKKIAVVTGSNRGIGAPGRGQAPGACLLPGGGKARRSSTS